MLKGQRSAGVAMQRTPTHSDLWQHQRNRWLWWSTSCHSPCSPTALQSSTCHQVLSAGPCDAGALLWTCTRASIDPRLWKTSTLWDWGPSERLLQSAHQSQRWRRSGGLPGPTQIMTYFFSNGYRLNTPATKMRTKQIQHKAFLLLFMYLNANKSRVHTQTCTLACTYTQIHTKPHLHLFLLVLMLLYLLRLENSNSMRPETG